MRERKKGKPRKKGLPLGARSEQKQIPSFWDWKDHVEIAEKLAAANGVDGVVGYLRHLLKSVADVYCRVGLWVKENPGRDVEDYFRTHRPGWAVMFPVTAVEKEYVVGLKEGSVDLESILAQCEGPILKMAMKLASCVDSETKAA